MGVMAGTTSSSFATPSRTARSRTHTVSAPMEECGGAHVMEVLKDPKHLEYQEAQEWIRFAWWLPLDVNKIDCWIRGIRRNMEAIWLG